ncbi:hypothetical protein NFJ02_32g82530 [Pycnococcus provasolii]
MFLLFYASFVQERSVGWQQPSRLDLIREKVAAIKHDTKARTSTLRLAVVRNPWQRARSAYLNKVRGGARRKVEADLCSQVMKSHELCDTNFVTWKSYLTRMAEIDMDDFNTNPHVASQTSMCGLDVVDYAYARVEHLANDMKDFSDCYGKSFAGSGRRMSLLYIVFTAMTRTTTTTPHGTSYAIIPHKTNIFQQQASVAKQPARTAVETLAISNDDDDDDKGNVGDMVMDCKEVGHAIDINNWFRKASEDTVNTVPREEILGTTVDVMNIDTEAARAS